MLKMGLHNGLKPIADSLVTPKTEVPPASNSTHGGLVQETVFRDPPYETTCNVGSLQGQPSLVLQTSEKVYSPPKTNTISP